MTGALLAGDDLAALDDIVDEAIQRSLRNRQTRRRLPGGGKLFVDGRTPFLAVYRAPPAGTDPAGARFARALRAHLVLPASSERVARRVCRGLCEAIAEDLGVALVLELWVAPTSNLPEHDAPTIGIHVVESDGAVAEAFRAAIASVRVLPEDEAARGKDRAEVSETRVPTPAPPGRPSILPDESVTDRICWVGIEIPGTFRAGDSVFPERLILLLRSLTSALEEGVHAWVAPRMQGKLEGGRHALGRQNLERTARAIDGRLADVAASFDLVLCVSPVNGRAMRSQFQKDREAVAPRFEYRPLEFDPEALKRSLFHVPLERIEDPLIAVLIREKQEELDLRISMLRCRGRPDFLLGSLQLFGMPDPALVDLALALLERSSPGDEEDSEQCDAGEPVNAEAFAAMARAEIDRYRVSHADFPRAIQLRDDISSGLLVSGGRLCIRPSLCLDARRADALLQHEVGTHLLTYFNGSRQPLRLLASGLARYGSLQEGLAVLSEHLVGGLTRARFRTLAARVVAVQARVDGADFVEAYRRLVDLGVRRASAFSIVARVYRGGGLTKDTQYLRGLRGILEYLRDGGPIEGLFVGKLGFADLGIVRELTARGIVAAPAVLPHYVREGSALRRLEECRGRTVLQLFDEAPP
jgi:uncharacterized protein (TIGR02421 family)